MTPTRSARPAVIRSARPVRAGRTRSARRAPATRTGPPRARIRSARPVHTARTRPVRPVHAARTRPVRPVHTAHTRPARRSRPAYTRPARPAHATRTRPARPVHTARTRPARRCRPAYTRPARPGYGARIRTGRPDHAAGTQTGRPPRAGRTRSVPPVRAERARRGRASGADVPTAPARTAGSPTAPVRRRSGSTNAGYTPMVPRAGPSSPAGCRSRTRPRTPPRAGPIARRTSGAPRPTVVRRLPANDGTRPTLTRTTSPAGAANPGPTGATAPSWSRHRTIPPVVGVVPASTGATMRCHSRSGARPDGASRAGGNPAGAGRVATNGVNPAVTGGGSPARVPPRTGESRRVAGGTTARRAARLPRTRTPSAGCRRTGGPRSPTATSRRDTVRLTRKPPHRHGRAPTSVGSARRPTGPARTRASGRSSSRVPGRSPTRTGRTSGTARPWIGRYRPGTRCHPPTPRAPTRAVPSRTVLLARTHATPGLPALVPSPAAPVMLSRTPPGRPPPRRARTPSRRVRRPVARSRSRTAAGPTGSPPVRGSGRYGRTSAGRRRTHRRRRGPGNGPTLVRSVEPTAGPRPRPSRPDTRAPTTVPVPSRRRRIRPLQRARPCAPATVRRRPATPRYGPCRLPLRTSSSGCRHRTRSMRLPV